MTGHNSIKMTDLLLLYKSMGFKDAITFIQSGNVVFSTKDEMDEPVIASKIEKAINKKFNYNVPVMIRTPNELREIISANPFLDEMNFEPSKMAVIFLHEKPLEVQTRKVINVDYPPDKFKISGSEIYLYCPNGFGRTKLYTNFFEKKMGVTGTGRNWKTISALLNIAEKL